MRIDNLTKVATKVSDIMGNAPGETMYGPPQIAPKGESIKLFIKLISLGIGIPLILIIGLIVYNKKSKSDKQIKIMVSIVAILITIIAMWFILNNLLF